MVIHGEFIVIQVMSTNDDRPTKTDPEELCERLPQFINSNTTPTQLDAIYTPRLSKYCRKRALAHKSSAKCSANLSKTVLPSARSGMARNVRDSDCRRTTMSDSGQETGRTVYDVTLRDGATTQ